ncbi:hypothetical protein EDC04DRAFT_998662 [Pisolithus marmoratus]|nr:hypothetical protein EDC04DRAFT_998662 [Pisolithus marmoratus]
MRGLRDLFRWSQKTTAILPTDIVVFIVGPTGSGKSRFMSILLQIANVHVRVNKGQRPGTTEVHAERCRFEGMQNDIVIVDTPSFYTYTDPDGEEVVKRWMGSNYTRPCKAAGVIYMHNLADNPEDTNLKVSKHLNAFRRTCRQGPIPGVIHVVPTLSYGATLSEERINTAMAQLRLQANSEVQPCNMSSDGKVFDGKAESAWDVIQGLLSALRL